MSKRLLEDMQDVLRRRQLFDSYGTQLLRVGGEKQDKRISRLREADGKFAPGCRDND